MPQSLAQFGQTIKAKHPEYADMADEDVANRVLAKYPQYKDMVETVAGAGPLGLPQPKNPTVDMQPSTLGSVVGAASPIIKAHQDLGTGILKGALSTVSSSDDWARQHLPAVLTNSNLGFGPPADLQHVKQMATPQNATQSVGKGLEQAGEFFIPGPAEEALAAKAAPLVGKALPAVKMGLAALGSGAVNATQGGSFKQGALAGGIGAGVGQLAAKAAPALAESALKVTGNDKTYGRTVGRAILDDTRGIRPGTVEQTARDTVSNLTPQVEQMAADAGASGSRGSLIPARDAVADVVSRHTTNRAVNSAAELKPLQDFLQTDAVTGRPLASAQTPTGLLQLKRGVDADFIGNWNPNRNNPNELQAAKQVYGQLADQFHYAAPGTKELDQRVSSLFPVIDRAQRAERGAGVLESTMNRFRAPTGALAGAAVGGVGSYEHNHSLPEALAAAAAGAVLPSAIAAPETQMALARMANMVPRFTPVLTGGALQYLSPKPDSKQK